MIVMSLVKEMLRLSSSALGEFEAKHRGQNIHTNKTLRIEQRLLAKFVFQSNFSECVIVVASVDTMREFRARSDMEAKKEQAEKRAALALKVIF